MKSHRIKETPSHLNGRRVGLLDGHLELLVLVPELLGVLQGLGYPQRGKEHGLAVPDPAGHVRGVLLQLHQLGLLLEPQASYLGEILGVHLALVQKLQEHLDTVAGRVLAVGHYADARLLQYLPGKIVRLGWGVFFSGLYRRCSGDLRVEVIRS